VYFNNRGATLYDMQSFDAAISDYSKAISLYPHDPLSYSNRGRIYYQTGQFERAIADYTEALA
jgi:tetratricopeptide (TPR) repeat protein